MTNKKYKNLMDLKNILKLDGILEEDYNFWKQIYKKRQKAMEKFGYIEADYEGIKIKGYKENNEEMIIYGYWCRSIIASQYNLNHPSYMEYRAHYQVGDVDWLEEGHTFVDIKKYKNWKKQNNKEE